MPQDRTANDLASQLRAGDTESRYPARVPTTVRTRENPAAFTTKSTTRAYMGRIWLAMSYNSWSEWCEGELGGFKLPAPKRREVVAELADAGMSNRAIADVIGVTHTTVNKDLKDPGGRNLPPDRKVTGQDGKAYTPSKPRPVPQNLASQDNQPVESPQKDVSEGATDEAKDSEMSMSVARCYGDKSIRGTGPQTPTKTSQLDVVPL